MVFAFMETLRFFFRKPRAPVLLDRTAAGREGAAAVFHEDLRREQVPEYTKRIPQATDFLMSKKNSA